MSNSAGYQTDINKAIKDFITVANLAGDPISLSEVSIDFLNSPHTPPSKIPAGKMAVYAFWWNGSWLKVGKVGPKSHARYTSQHYNPNSSGSNLAKSLVKDTRMNTVTGFGSQNPGGWIQASTSRVNILIPSTRNKELLSLLESFLHVRLKPLYEG